MIVPGDAYVQQTHYTLYFERVEHDGTAVTTSRGDVFLIMYVNKDSNGVVCMCRQQLVEGTQLDFNRNSLFLQVNE